MSSDEDSELTVAVGADSHLRADHAISRVWNGGCAVNRDFAGYVSFSVCSMEALTSM